VIRGFHSFQRYSTSLQTPCAATIGVGEPPPGSVGFFQIRPEDRAPAFPNPPPGSVGFFQIRPEDRAPAFSNPPPGRVGFFQIRPEDRAAAFSNPPPGRVGFFQIRPTRGERDCGCVSAFLRTVIPGALLSQVVPEGTSPFRVGDRDLRRLCCRLDLEVPHPSGWGIRDLRRLCVGWIWKYPTLPGGGFATCASSAVGWI
jgi:hypothetical protein